MGLSAVNRSGTNDPAHGAHDSLDYQDPFLIVWGASHDPAPIGHKLPILTTAYGHVEIPLIITLFILFMGILKIILPYANKLSPKVPDCCLLISLGFAIGGLVFCTRDFGFHNESYINIVESLFNPSTFFLILLPPIVLEAGYYMPKGPFMHNIGTILTYAIIGTIFNSFCTGGALYGVYKAGWMPGLDDAHEMPVSPLHMLLFGSIISAVDPVAVIAVFEEIQVNMLLYICVFGESLLNDGVAVVLFKVFEAFLGMDEADIDAKNILRAVLKFFVVAGGGTLFGIVCGYVGAFSTKYTQNKTLVEPLFIFGVSYACYLGRAQNFKIKLKNDQKLKNGQKLKNVKKSIDDQKLKMARNRNWPKT